MFERVIVSEDHEIANLSLRKTLQELNIPQPDYAFYCDITLSKIRKALSDGKPYELLITDLYFEPDGSAQQLPDGAALIRQAKAVQPNLKTLIFSAESRVAIIQPLFDELAIDGYVRKSRGDAHDLKEALERIAMHRRHYPRELRMHSAQQDFHAFSDYDKIIIRLLAEGKTQKKISDYLEKEGIYSSSLSSIEKRLKTIKTTMSFSTNEQLAVFCRDMGII